MAAFDVITQSDVEGSWEVKWRRKVEMAVITALYEGATPSSPDELVEAVMGVLRECGDIMDGDALERRREEVLGFARRVRPDLKFDGTDRKVIRVLPDNEDLVIDGDTEIDDLLVVSRFAQAEVRGSRPRESVCEPLQTTRVPRTCTVDFDESSEETEADEGGCTAQPHKRDGCDDLVAKEASTEHEGGARSLAALLRRYNMAAVPEDNSDSEVEAELDSSSLSSAINLAAAAGLPTKVDDAEPISELGTVHAVAQGYVVVAGKPGAQPIDVMSLVCDSNRKAVGLVCDILGRVSQAFYAVCPTRTDIAVSDGDVVYAVATWSSLALVDDGSESNDEEEFSDGMEDQVNYDYSVRGVGRMLPLDAVLAEGRVAADPPDMSAPTRKPPPPPPPPSRDAAVSPPAPGSKRTFEEMMEPPPHRASTTMVPKTERDDSYPHSAAIDPVRATKAQLVRGGSARHPPPPPPPPPPRLPTPP